MHACGKLRPFQAISSTISARSAAQNIGRIVAEIKYIPSSHQSQFVGICEAIQDPLLPLPQYPKIASGPDVLSASAKAQSIYCHDNANDQDPEGDQILGIDLEEFEILSAKGYFPANEPQVCLLRL